MTRKKRKIAAREDTAAVSALMGIKSYSGGILNFEKKKTEQEQNAQIRGKARKQPKWAWLFLHVESDGALFQL